MDKFLENVKAAIRLDGGSTAIVMFHRVKRGDVKNLKNFKLSAKVVDEEKLFAAYGQETPISRLEPVKALRAEDWEELRPYYRPEMAKFASELANGISQK
jgi:hypothetical protein